MVFYSNFAVLVRFRTLSSRYKSLHKDNNTYFVSLLVCSKGFNHMQGLVEECWM